MIDFFVAGTPSTQGNKTGFVNKATGRAILREGRSKQAKSNFDAWRHAVSDEARDAIDTPLMAAANWPITDPVVVCLTFGLQRPTSAPKRRRTWPIGARSGDVDKLARAVLDAITGVLIADDAQVVGLSVTKGYRRPGCRVQLWPETEMQLWVPEWHTLAYVDTQAAKQAAML